MAPSMPLLLPDRRRRGILPALAAAVAHCMLAVPAIAAQAPTPDIDVKGSDLEGNISSGTFSLRELVVTQPPSSTVIRADHASVRGLQGSGGFNNTNWDLQGTVHVEYEGTVLDADGAQVVFADGRLQSVQMQGTVRVAHEGVMLDADGAQVAFANGRLQSVQVQGLPARFSHQRAGSKDRPQGRANTITYTATTGSVRFSGDTWYSDGGREVNSPTATYNVRDSRFNTRDEDGEPVPFQMTIRGDRDERVPPPRTPDRGIAP